MRSRRLRKKESFQAQERIRFQAFISNRVPELILLYYSNLETPKSQHKKFIWVKEWYSEWSPVDNALLVRLYAFLSIYIQPFPPEFGTIIYFFLLFPLSHK